MQVWCLGAGTCVWGSGVQVMCWGLGFQASQASGVPAHVSLYVGLGYVCGPGILGVCIQAPGGMF